MNKGVPLQVGDKYNRLTVESYSHTDSHPRRYFNCVCECGGRVVTHTNSLRTGNTKSCGCLSRERKAATRLPNDRAVINQIILQYKRHAKSRGIEFLIEYDLVEKLVRAPCHYCGDPAGNLKKTKDFQHGFAHNGIDRVDSGKNYTSDNVVPCCGICNIAKRDMSMAQFIAWAGRITSHQQSVAKKDLFTEIHS